MAIEALRANRLRSLLTTLGIVIGIVTVTLMGMAIEGLNNSFMNSVSQLGADTLYVQRMPWMRMTYRDWLRFQSRPPLDMLQVRALEKRATNALAIAPMTEGRWGISYKIREIERVPILGATDQYPLTSGISLAQGRFFTAQESSGGRPVCVLGATVASNLFRGESPLGERVRIRGEAVEVIGVIDKRGTFMGGFNFDNQVIIPLKFFLTTFTWSPEFTLQVRAKSVAALAVLADEIRGMMRMIRKVEPGQEDDFAINQQQSIVESFGRVSAMIASVGLFISGLSLFVGGIGIMNIMFVSVAERTREIGLRKAIGAKRRVILTQFLIEAATICLMAGLIGLLIAWAASLGISKVMPVGMSFRVAGAAIGVSLLVGVVSGFLPAWRAARLDPVEALRNE